MARAKAKKDKAIDQIPLVKVPPEHWDEMLARGDYDPKMAVWIWSCWQLYNDSHYNPLDEMDKRNGRFSK
jgi:hypothetical protein